MLKLLIFSLVSGAALLGQTTTVPATGSGRIQGAVTESSSHKPIAGAYVTALRSGLPPLSQVAQTATDGSYEIKELPAGTFSLCVQAPGDGYLLSCHWGATPPSVTLTAGQVSAGNQLTMTAGWILKVRIQDPNQTLAQKTKQGFDPDLVMGVFGPPGLFYPTHRTGTDAAGADYQLTIPLNTPVTFSIASTALQLNDSNGVALPNGFSKQGVQSSAVGSNPTSFVYTVTGQKP